jgi:uncharacterized protein
MFIIDQLVLQPTSFCNINCRYCYLPDRSRPTLMSEATLEATFREVLNSTFVRPRLLIVWSLGEPLSAPIGFYQRAFALAELAKRADVMLMHHFQTNGTLLSDEWCEFIKGNRVGIAVSIDGPRALHNESRRTRGGGGTFDQAMRGVRLLQEHEIDFGVISVVTSRTLDQPDLLFDFYEEYGLTRVGLNVEEIDGANQASSLSCVDVERRYRQFLRRIFDRFRASSTVKYLREYRPSAVGALVDLAAKPRTADPRRPGIVSVSVGGDFTLLGPELLGIKDADGTEFSVGNFLRDSLTSALRSEEYRRQSSQVEEGVAACKRSCRYFPVCGGGPPSNKYFENGTFASTETLYCRLSCKASTDITLEVIADGTQQKGRPAATQQTDLEGEI